MKKTNERLKYGHPLEAVYGTWYDLMEKVESNFRNSPDEFVTFTWWEVTYLATRDGRVEPFYQGSKRPDNEEQAFRLETAQSLREAWEVVRRPNWREDAQLEAEADRHWDRLKESLAHFSPLGRIQILQELLRQFPPKQSNR